MIDWVQLYRSELARRAQPTGAVTTPRLDA
jgi:hypothetical protein